MEHIFKKSNLETLAEVVGSHKDGRKQWMIARLMQDQDGFRHHVGTELLLLQRGACNGDPWSMCELARTYFHHCPDLFLPHALMWWNNAILHGDPGAQFDVERLPIRDRILSCQVEADDYANMEIKCAMLAQWHLNRMGLAYWSVLTPTQQMNRIRHLIDDVEPLLMLPRIHCEIVSGLNLNGKTVDGLAHWDDKIQIREEIVSHLPRLIQVLFHELGHQVSNQIRKNTPLSPNIQAFYGLSDQRVESWEKGVMGYEVPTSEEDPDTLAYGIYTQWALFFEAL